jgi:glycosyltransferase involved in cell wall biosynthesis
MTSYNGEEYIRSQIDSILSQLKDEDELIISDDGSTDATLDLIRRYKDNRIKLYTNNFHNHILNFEYSLSRATGDYIFLSDQDDVWFENKIAKCVEAFDCCDLICSDCVVVDSQLNIIHDSFYNEPIKKRKGFFRNLIHNHYLGCCMAFNRKILSHSLPFPDKLITHDTWIGLVAELVGKTKFIDDKLIYYRRHNTNTSNTLCGSTLSFADKISYRLIILKGLIYNVLLKKCLRIKSY